MTSVFVASDDLLWRLAGSAAPADGRVYVVESGALRARLARHGAHAIAGDLEDDAVYRRALRSGHEPVVVAVPAARRRRVLAALRRAAPDAPVLLLVERENGADAPGVATVPLAAIVERVIEPGIERATVRARVERLRRQLDGAERLLVLVQDDPDPDAIASALALRALLGRARAGATIASFGAIRRPENRAMTRILDIEVDRIDPAALGRYDAIAIVDAQPAFFEERLGDVAAVIDHHPEETPARAAFKDIRSGYGATSTILTEYLRAVDAKFSPRVATALLYGIKSDTLHLERGATRSDMEAFAFLHPLANHSALRRIERPELPEAAFETLAAGIARRHVAHGVVFAHLGPVAYAELVAQFADLFLQMEGAEWSVVSGTVDGELHVSVRNVGYVRGAGDVVRQAFGALGSAGGHRAMAKAVIPLREWRERVGDTGPDALAAAIVTRFQRALRAAPER